MLNLVYFDIDGVYVFWKRGVVVAVKHGVAAEAGE